MFVQILIVLYQSEFSVFLFYEENGEAWGDFDGQIWPVCKFSSMKALQASISWGFSGYSLATFGTNESFKSMVWLKLW